MSGKILEAFREKETFNIFELMLRLQVDKDCLKEILDTLVNHGKLSVEREILQHKDNLPGYKCLYSRSSIRGISGETYMLKR